MNIIRCNLMVLIGEPLGRRVLIQSLNDYLDETIEIKGLVRSRQYQIFLYAQNLAQQFKKAEK